MASPDSPSFGPRIPEETSIANAQVLVDGALLSHLGQALLARKKTQPRPSPDDCSRNDEELTHLFVGDRAACISAANGVASTSGGALFGPQCGRSGRDVKVIRCLDDKPPEEPILYAAIAVHYLCKRDVAGTLDANPILLTNKAPSTWEADFKRSYLANCSDDDPAGGLPEREHSPGRSLGRSMEPIDPKLQEDLLAALAKHSDRLRELPNVEHVDIGFRIAGGRYTGELSLRVFVREKLPLSDLTLESIVPASLDGIDVDVITSKRSLHGAVRDRRFDPVLGGIETANRRFHTGGTLGMVVKDLNDGSPLALSNYHVWVKHVGQQGDEIVQPRATSDECVIGTLVRWDENLDCAVAALNGARFLQTGTAIGIDRSTTGIAHPRLGMLVVKSSTVTGVTYGFVEGMSETEMTITPDPVHSTALNQISLPGDSGAVWLDPLTGDAIALHYAGESPGYPDRAWAKRFEAVAAALQITF